MEIKRNMVKRKVVDETILVPIDNTSLSVKGLITLNESAELIWDALPDAKSESELAELLCAEYEVTADEAKRDVGEFLESLRQYGII